MNRVLLGVTIAAAVLVVGGGGVGIGVAFSHHDPSTMAAAPVPTVAPGATDAATLPADTPAPTTDAQLSFTAEHEGCGNYASVVYQYLRTGSPHTVQATDGNTIDLDQRFASERAQILTQPGDAQDGLMQAQSRAAGEGCDQSLDQQAVAAAQAQAQASQQAAAALAQAEQKTAAQQAAAAQDAMLARFRTACSSIGVVYTILPAKPECRKTADGSDVLSDTDRILQWNDPGWTDVGTP